MSSRRQTKQSNISNKLQTNNFIQSSEFENKIKNILSTLPSLLQTIQENIDDEKKADDGADKLQAKLEVETKECIAASCKQKLLNIYNARQQKLNIQDENIREVLATITEIRNLSEKQRMITRLSGQSESDERKNVRRGVLMYMLTKDTKTLPLWIGREGQQAPPLCGAIPAAPDYVAEAGSKVAARVKTPHNEEDQWILAEVISFNLNTQKYTVDDIDEEGRETHVLSKRRVVPLPSYRANPETDRNALFQVGTVVMALYPQTTCFYRAKVDEQPKDLFDDYSVLFEDQTYPNGYSPALKVAQKYIVVTKEIKESKKK